MHAPCRQPPPPPVRVHQRASHDPPPLSPCRIVLPSTFTGSAAAAWPQVYPRQLVVSTSVASVDILAVADVDGDGTLDIVSGSTTSDAVVWIRRAPFSNLGNFGACEGASTPQVLAAFRRCLHVVAHWTVCAFPHRRCSATSIRGRVRVPCCPPRIRVSLVDVADD
jgi:hypothetical protein